VIFDGSQEEGSKKEESSKEDRKKEKISSLTHILIFFWLGEKFSSFFLRSYNYET
jgi:hypothetical protein